jgi:hypothetical protein
MCPCDVWRKDRLLLALLYTSKPKDIYMKPSLLLAALALFAAPAVQAGTASAKASAAVAPVEEAPLGIAVTAGYESAYIFRGVKYGDNLIEAGISVPIKLSDKLTFTFAPWYGIADDNNYNELDLVASLGYDTGFGTLSVGYTWYYYDFSGFDTSEPFVSFAKSFGPVNWTIGAYLDVNADGGDLYANKGGSEGYYFETAIEMPLKVSDQLSIVPSAKISYGTDYYGVDGFNNVLVKVSAPYAVTKSFTIAPFIAASFAIDSLSDLGVDDYLVGGAMLTYTF